MKKIVFFLLITNTLVSYADYDTNMRGHIKNIFTYPYGLVLFKLDNQPNHPTCNSGYFAIGTDVSEAGANRMFSMLLTLHTKKAEAYIGYDSKGDCANGYIRVHNIGETST